MRTLLLTAFFLLVCPGIAQGPVTPFDIDFNVVRNTVVFIYQKSEDSRTKADGTAFLITGPSKANPKRSYVILVTARHMVDPIWLGCPGPTPHLIARFNKAHFDPKAGGIGTTDYDLSQNIWIRPDDSADLAYTVLNGDKLRDIDAKFDAISLSEFPKANELKDLDSGATILSAGLFPGSTGKLRNYPIFKFGNVSSRPDETVTGPKECLGGREIQLNLWMIAASLVSGNSGSPILYVPPRFAGRRAVLLGIQSCAWEHYDVAGMVPIQFLIDSLKSGGIPDLDVSEFDRAPTGNHGTAVTGNVVIQ